MEQKGIPGESNSVPAATISTQGEIGPPGPAHALADRPPPFALFLRKRATYGQRSSEIRDEKAQGPDLPDNREPGEER